LDDKDLWKNYCNTIHSLHAHNSKTWAQIGLTMPQIKIMFILAHKEELTVSAIAKILNVRAPNVTFILDHLEEQKIVCRKRCRDDRRLVLVTLTKKGHQLFGKLHEANLENFLKTVATMSNKDKAALRQGLQALEKACEIQERGEINEQ